MAIDFTVEHVRWEATHKALQSVRETVFVEEQHVPADMEWDDSDRECDHVIAYAVDKQPIGTGRLLKTGQIGRMAVLPAQRNRGVGTRMLQILLNLARAKGMPRVFLHAQRSAVPFYKRHGFIVTSDEFMEAGIPHYQMERQLK
jgi:predicted GNAT family N-acyltransferase